MIWNTRLTPTPSGYIHIGNAFNFLLAWLCARKSGGSVRLRIDDYDASRTRSEHLQDIFASLDWLKLDWDSGPRSVEEHYKQLEYEKEACRLSLKELSENKAELLYGCRCSRSEIHRARLKRYVTKSNSKSDDNLKDKRQGDEYYSGLCRGASLALNASNTAWRMRFDSPEEIIIPDLLHSLPISKEEGTGDYVIRRRDGEAGYHFASLFADEHSQVNLIVRGRDLLASSQAQIHLANVLAYQNFLNCKFIHHGLFMNSEGDKLSKSLNSQSLLRWRDESHSSEQLYQHFAKILKLPFSPDFKDPNDLLNAFRISSIPLEDYTLIGIGNF